MNGVKIAVEGDINGRELADYAVDSDHPLWMCNLEASPLHYGFIRCRIPSLSAFASRTVLSVTHGYEIAPSFISQWYYPDGAGGDADLTYGIGSLEIHPSTGGTVTFQCRSNDTRFLIEVESTSSVATTDLYAEFKFYIFAQPFVQLLDQ